LLKDEVRKMEHKKERAQNTNREIYSDQKALWERMDVSYFIRRDRRHRQGRKINQERKAIRARASDSQKGR